MDEIVNMRAFTKALTDQVLQDISSRPTPDIIIMAPCVKAVFVTYDTADREKWNWRRTKRELRRIGLVRKGARREYHKRAA